MSYSWATNAIPSKTILMPKDAIIKRTDMAGVAHKIILLGPKCYCITVGMETH